MRETWLLSSMNSAAIVHGLCLELQLMPTDMNEMQYRTQAMDKCCCFWKKDYKLLSVGQLPVNICFLVTAIH